MATATVRVPSRAAARAGEGTVSLAPCAGEGARRRADIQGRARGEDGAGAALTPPRPLHLQRGWRLILPAHLSQQPRALPARRAEPGPARRGCAAAALAVAAPPVT